MSGFLKIQFCGTILAIMLSACSTAQPIISGYYSDHTRRHFHPVDAQHVQVLRSTYPRDVAVEEIGDISIQAAGEKLDLNALLRDLRKEAGFRGAHFVVNLKLKTDHKAKRIGHPRCSEYPVLICSEYSHVAYYSVYTASGVLLRKKI